MGANIGYLSMYFAHPRHQLGALHAFEPNPNALKTLQSLFRDHPRARVHPVGLGRADEQLSMNVLPTESRLGSMTRSLDQGERITIQIRRGDSYRAEQQLPAPDVIKIDVEGLEPHVLEGLAQTIAQGQPLIILEHIWLSDEELRHITPPGYSTTFILDDGGVTSEFSERMKGHNALLRPPDRAPAAPPSV